MHHEAMVFCRSAAGTMGRFDIDARGLELGAYDVNGSARGCYDGVAWWGVDLRPGPGVDEVADAAEGLWKDFDIVLCTEMLEHARDPEACVESALQALKPGGYFVMTCAAPDRLPHDNDGNHGDFSDYYKNVSPDEFRGWIDGYYASVEYYQDRGDLYALVRV